MSTMSCGTDESILPDVTFVYQDLQSSVNFPLYTTDLQSNVNFTESSLPLETNIISGSVSNVLVGNSPVIVVQATVGTSNGFLETISCNGDTDAKYYFYINGVLTLTFTSNIITPNIFREFVRPIALSNSDILEITVVNEGLITANFYAAFTGVF